MMNSLSTKQQLQKETKILKQHLDSQKRRFLAEEKAISKLPANGWSPERILAYLTQRKKKDATIPRVDWTVSGSVYVADEKLEPLLCDVYRLHALTSALHPEFFPSVRQMESEVVSMCAKLMDPKGMAEEVCGAMTCGGTESILLAVKASKIFMELKKGITEPEMIICESAHPAFLKAAEYFNIKVIVLKANKEYTIPMDSLKKNIGKNTILLIASAPGFPHGVIDQVEEMSEIAVKNDILLHVDCCLGGLFLPFARNLGYKVPEFDFSLKGVTSISVDTHKYGMSHKGTAVSLYRTPDLRKHQYSRFMDWSGGLYASPGITGTRSGALVSTAWTGLVYLGQDGLTEVTKNILKAIDEFRAEIHTIPDLELMGDPMGPVIAFKLKERPERIYKVNELMTEKGWCLSSMQLPPALHMCYTGRHINISKRLIQDLKDCVEVVKRDYSEESEGAVAVYCTACSVPNPEIVPDLLSTYLDSVLSL